MIKSSDKERLFIVNVKEAWQIINDVKIDRYCETYCFKTPRFDPIERPYYLSSDHISRDLSLANC